MCCIVLCIVHLLSSYDLRLEAPKKEKEKDKLAYLFLK